MDSLDHLANMQQARKKDYIGYTGPYDPGFCEGLETVAVGEN